MSSVATHLAAWQAAGLIDAETADRLRAADADEPGSLAIELPATAPAPQPSAASAFFGPGVSIAEAFAYIGGGFLLAGWLTLIAAFTAGMNDRAPALAVVSAMSVVAAGVIGYSLSTGSARLARAAGVMFLVADAFAAATVAAGADAIGIQGDGTIAVLAACAYLVAAIVFRVAHPSVLTTVGLLIGITATAGTLYLWIGDRIFPSRIDSASPAGADESIKVILTMAWWWGTAVIMGVIGLVEAGRGTAAADRRAGMVRFWAGIVAVSGTWVAVSTRAADGRILPEIVGDIVILGVSAILLGLAFRREAPAYVIAAAYGIILALTDLNAAYVASEGTGAAVPLLLEGAILVGVGVAADRLRRRIGPGRDDGPADPEVRTQAAT